LCNHGFASSAISPYVALMDGAGQLSLLELRGVACRRGGRLLFTGVNFGLNAGDALILSGPNGVGKSSLLRLIAGLLDPFAGSVARREAVALASEELALDREKPLAGALQFWAGMDGGNVRAALAAFGIAHLAPVPVRMLSTGQRKRAVLARTLSSNAQIWLLDEPGNGLDAEALPLLEAAIAQHRATGGVVIVATHQPLSLPGATSLALSAPTLEGAA
jgi:heme exporter protein A